jgi:hypothetical protein
VVGGIVGSSLLTIACFVLILRHRRNKRRQLRRGRGGSRDEAKIGYPDVAGRSNSVSSLKKGGYAASDDDRSSTYSTDDQGFKFPPDIKRPEPVGGLTRSGTAVISRKNVGIGYAVSYYGPRAPLNGVTGAKFQLGDPPPPRGGKFSLFPQPKGETSPRAVSRASSLGGNASVGLDDAEKGQQRGRASNTSIPTLDKWMRDGTTVSPFLMFKESPRQG